MPAKAFTLPLALALLAGCASDSALPLPTADHPASPDAPSAPPPPVSQTLSLNPATAPAATQPAAQAAYTCPHHPEVISDQPAQCPKCNMKLVPKDQGAAPAHEGHR
jgi:hypothetical protein